MAKVLVVDDIPGMRAIGALVLRMAGHDVETASNGREALGKVAALKPDLILLDLSMPEMDGFQVLAALRGAASRPPMPVVIFSGVDDAQTRLRAAELGAAGFVTKRAADAFSLRHEVDQHIPPRS
jgi:CheY-like chemotaxis protein